MTLADREGQPDPPLGEGGLRSSDREGGQAATRPVDPIPRADRTGQAWETCAWLMLVTGEGRPQTVHSDSGEPTRLIVHPVAFLHYPGQPTPLPFEMAENPESPWETMGNLRRLI